MSNHLKKRDKVNNLVEYYSATPLLDRLGEALAPRQVRLHLDGMTGSMPAVVAAALAERQHTSNQIIVAPSKEDAYYTASDLGALGCTVMLFPMVCCHILPPSI